MQRSPPRRKLEGCAPLSDWGELLLTVRQTSTPEGLALGATLAVASEAVLGRSPEATVQLADRTISRRHARVWPTSSGWQVCHLAEGNGAFLDGAPLAVGVETPLIDGSSLQLGGVVFAVQVVLGTLPFTTPLRPLRPAPAAIEPLTVGASGEPLLVVRRDGDGCTVHCGERLLPLAPTAALVLAALAARPGVVVHGWDIHEDVGYACNLPQAVSAIRRALRALIDEGSLAAGPLAQAVASVYAEAPVADDVGALLRALVLARRGHGYGLMLPAQQVRVETEG